MRQILRFAAVVVLTAALLPVPGSAVTPRSGPPYLDPRQPVERRVADLLSRMSLDDKIGQMTQTERAEVADSPGRVTEWRLGSVLSGGGSVPTPNTPEAWAGMVDSLQRAALATPLRIPLLYGVDAVHGHGNVHGATIFPHNVGLGAGRDPGLVERVYRATAEQMLATGIRWDFAPCLCVSRDERWGRAYESFGEDPTLVAELGGSAVDGLQRNGVVATVKHFAGDGDTEHGTGDSGYAIDQGVTVTSRDDFARIDLAPYDTAVRRHRALSVMPSFSSVDWTEDGIGDPVKMHAGRELLTRYLKGELGFGGFVISDWEGIHQLPSGEPAGTPEPTATQVRTGVNAGIDMFMEPRTAAEFQRHLTAEVRAGRVPQSRIDDAVTRILRVKFGLGLFENPWSTPGPVDSPSLHAPAVSSPSLHAPAVDSPSFRALAREAVAKSQVLLKNDGVLPLSPGARIYVAGRNADDIGNQAGGWTVDWQGRDGDTIPGDTILDGIRAVAPSVTYSPDASAPISDSDVGVVVVGETPYAEGYGDVGSPVWSRGTERQREPKLLTLQPPDSAVIDKVCDAVTRCVVLIVSGRPQVITDRLGKIDALVASWLPGSEGAGVADVLFGKLPFTGKLSLTWPRTAAQVPINPGDPTYQPLFPYGWGLHTVDDNLRGKAVDRAVSGAALAGWEKLFAEAELATDAADTAAADTMFSRLTR